MNNHQYQTRHRHEPGEFDPGHCRVCAASAGLLDHYRRVQDHESALQKARQTAERARRYALSALAISLVGSAVAWIATLTT